MYKNVEYYSLNLMSRNLQSVTKIIETHYIFMKMSKKNVRLAQRCPEFPLCPGSMLYQVWKSYVRQWWPEMTKQTCSQH